MDPNILNVSKLKNLEKKNFEKFEKVKTKTLKMSIALIDVYNI